MAGTLDRLTLLPLAGRGYKFAREDDTTHALAELYQADQRAAPQVLFERVSLRFGWQMVSEPDHKALRDAAGRVQLTYRVFKKRLARIRKAPTRRHQT